MQKHIKSMVRWISPPDFVEIGPDKNQRSLIYLAAYSGPAAYSDRASLLPDTTQHYDLYS